MPREAPRQYPLELPHASRFGTEDYLIGPANAAAHALVTSWPAWPDRLLLLIGEEGAGKSHLAEIWRSEAGATAAADAGNAIALFLERPGRAVLLEDADRTGADEDALFHLLNTARERGGDLLLTARSAPSPAWPSLPDLASRLRALPVARLEPPDEAMVKAVLVKMLDDRQLRVEADVVEFIARRSDRSIGAIRRVVAELDRESLARGRAVGRGLAADVLARSLAEED
ncbi:hypothetical protein ACIKT0_05610 [Hansschlegelia beijingensis]|uniref:hypothetical protein n=1 Tax=Hansschlegelia beijingensis TaxID=1133344 RepID=UPI00387EF5A2